MKIFCKPKGQARPWGAFTRSFVKGFCENGLCKKVLKVGLVKTTFAKVLENWSCRQVIKLLASPVLFSQVLQKVFTTHFCKNLTGQNMTKIINKVLTRGFTRCILITVKIANEG